MNTAEQSLPLWRQPLARTLHKTNKKPESRYFQLASQTLKNKIANRTVVFRGFDQQSRLLVITDKRSEKWAQINKKPAVGLCWYFSDTREQYRMEGKGTFIDASLDQPLINQYWHELSNAAKTQFLWGEPGTARQKDQSLRINVDSIPSLAPAHFSILAISVDYMDHLNLRGDPQRRIAYKKDSKGRWKSLELIP